MHPVQALSSICLTCLLLTCTHAGTVRLGVRVCAAPGWPAGCNFLSGLETEIYFKRLSGLGFVFFYGGKKNRSILYDLTCDTFIFTILKRISLQYIFKCLELGRLSQWI